MSERWSFGPYVFAKLDLKAMYGLPGLGFYRLIVQVDITTHGKEPGQEVTVTNIGGELYVTGKGKTEHFLGYVRRQGVDYPIATIKGTADRQLQLEVDLNPRQVQAIEDIRLGGDLRFKLSLYGIASRGGQGGPSNVSATFHYRANQSTWLEVLEQMQYRRTMLLEIPILDDHISPHFPEATKHLQTAQKHLLTGHFRDSVGSCRDVLESLEKALGDKQEIDSSGFGKQREKTKEERLRLVRKALKVFTHPARHADDVAAQMEWGPIDARVVIIMTASVLQMAIEEKGHT